MFKKLSDHVIGTAGVTAAAMSMEDPLTKKFARMAGHPEAGPQLVDFFVGLGVDPSDAKRLADEVVEGETKRAVKATQKAVASKAMAEFKSRRP